MIEGMEILNKTEILTQNYWWLLGALGCVAASFFFAWLYREFADFWAIFGLLSGAAALVCLFLMLVPTVPSGRYKYEVLLDESVDMKEVYEWYEVVDTKGKIYILRDRKPVDNVCTNCNAQVDDTDKFCPECGTKIEERR